MADLRGKVCIRAGAPAGLPAAATVRLGTKREVASASGAADPGKAGWLVFLDTPGYSHACDLLQPCGPVMSWYDSLFRPNAWDTGEIPIPWTKGRPSIYRFVEEHLNPDGPGLTDGGETLPDEEILFQDCDIRWAAGAREGAFGHDGGSGSDDHHAVAVMAALRKALKKPDWHRIKTLYDLLVEDNLFDFIDPLLRRLGTAGQALDTGRLTRLGHFFATEAPDRGPVKFGIAVCGAMACGADRSLFLTLGRQEEFTLYAVVALIKQAAINGEAYPEAEIWQLARETDGWGRIHAVERLAGTQNTAIKAWLLREGYRNQIMNEYLAFTAATAGGLLDALKDPDPDSALLEGAGEIIEALLCGEVAEDIDSYQDGVEAIALYLGHMRGRARSLSQLCVVAAIRDFLNSDEKEEALGTLELTDQEREWAREAAEESKARWEARRSCGWTHERQQALQALAEEILAQPHWRDAVMEGLEAEEDRAFWTARGAAQVLGIDSWEHSFERQRSGRGDEWFHLMRTDDPKRVDRVIALAKELIPLDRIATGPAEELGLGPGFEHHSALNFIVQDLRRFPGKGWSLIRTALESPVGRNRNMAVKALSRWGRENWPPEAEAALRRAMAREPNADLREAQAAALAGGSSDH